MYTFINDQYEKIWRKKFLRFFFMEMVAILDFRALTMVHIATSNAVKSCTHNVTHRTIRIHINEETSCTRVFLVLLNMTLLIIILLLDITSNYRSFNSAKNGHERKWHRNMTLAKKTNV